MRFRKAATRAGSVLVFLIFCLSLFVFITVIANWGKGVPSFYGYSFLSVTTPSMEPGYPVGSIVITKKVNIADFAVGDVVSFYSDDPDIYGTPNTHRIIEIGVNEVNKTYFVTRGDNNPVADRYKVYEDKVIGKVQGSVGSLGKLLAKIKNRFVLFFLLIVPLGILVFFEIRHISKLLKTRDGDAVPGGENVGDGTAQDAAAENADSGNDELIDKINRIQAEIDKINAKPNNPDIKK